MKIKIAFWLEMLVFVFLICGQDISALDFTQSRGSYASVVTTRPYNNQLSLSWSNRPYQLKGNQTNPNYGFIGQVNSPCNYPPCQPTRLLNTSGKNEGTTDEDLINLTETLFSKDTNNQNKNIVVNYQRRTRSFETTDEAPLPLLQIRNEVFQSPTISKLRLLYNNYEVDTTVNEDVTTIERQEENDFIDAVLQTEVMKQAMQFLKDKGVVTSDPQTHRDLLKTIWFTLYSRGGGRVGSSAFEHVFLNEVKNGTVSGFHNWIYFSDQESQGNVDYHGYIKKLELGNYGAIAKFRFSFKGTQKPVNAIFIGTSPELEMALYTVCFELRANKDCPVSASGKKFNIKTYAFRYRGKNLIGSAFPEI